MLDLQSFIEAPDRYPIYKSWRDESPALRLDFGGSPVWVLSRHQDVSALLKDPAARMKPPGTGAPAGFTDPITLKMFKAQLVLSDPPDHDRLRRLVAPAFSPSSIGSLREWIEQMVEARVKELAGCGSFDMMEDLVAYVPGNTILKILGIPKSDWEPLIGRVPAFLNFFSPFLLEDAAREATEEACCYYYDYFGALVDERRGKPGDDIIGRLITAHDDQDSLSHDELIGIMHAFLNAGFETTNSALGSGVFGLLSQGTPWRQLCADPSLAGAALEETLRWEAPIHFTWRYPASDLTVGDTVIPAGEPVLACLASANRDERKFADPDIILLDRPAREYMTFGGGRHFCVGSHLAKLEARTVLSTLARHMPDLELEERDPEKHPLLMFPALKRLKVRRGGDTLCRDTA